MIIKCTHLLLYIAVKTDFTILLWIILTGTFIDNLLLTFEPKKLFLTISYMIIINFKKSAN